MSELDRLRWDARYRALPADFDDRGPNPFLKAAVSRLPRPGRVLDVAGGDGRNAVWLASQGWTVLVADLAAEALRRAEIQAQSAGVAVATRQVDLELESFPAGPWDLIVCVAYLHRPLFESFAAELTPGGHLLVVHPTTRNLERWAHPSERYLLGEGELARLLAGWSILRIEESWRSGPAGRHEARCVARKPTELERT